MTKSADGIELTLFSKPQLLITESAEDFAALNAALMEEIKPRGIIERLYVDDIAALVWEILRLRRCKVAMVNTAFKNALAKIVYRLAGEPEMDTPEREWYEAIIIDWFSKPEARKEVSELLAEFHLDEFAIEAEATARVTTSRSRPSPGWRLPISTIWSGRTNMPLTLVVWSARPIQPLMRILVRPHGLLPGSAAVRSPSASRIQG